MEYIFIYLLQLSERLDYALQASIIALIITTFIMFPVSIINKNSSEDEQLLANFAKKAWATSLVLFICLFLAPTKQTMLLIGGTYIGKKAVNKIVTSEKLQKIDTIINLELDKRINELKKDEVKNDNN